LNESIFGIAQYVHRLIVSRTKKTFLAKENNSDYTLTYQNTTWITLQALKFALKPKNSRYSDLLKKMIKFFIILKVSNHTIQNSFHNHNQNHHLILKTSIPHDNMTASQLFLSHPFSTMLY